MTCGGAVAGIAASTPVSWVSSASVILLRPKSGPDPTEDNPYLGFGDNLRATADVLTTMLSGPATKRALIERGASGRYRIGADPDAPGSPVLRLRAVASAASMAARTRDALVGLLNADLAARQTRAGAPSGTLITAVLVAAQPPASDASGRTRIAVFGGLGSAGASLAAAAGAAAVTGARKDSPRRTPGSRVSVPAAAPPPPAAATDRRS